MIFWTGDETLAFDREMNSIAKPSLTIHGLRRIVREGFYIFESGLFYY